MSESWQVNPEIIAAWTPWWASELRHLDTEEMQRELAYTKREVLEAFDDPLIADGYLENPESRVAGLVLRQKMLNEELRRRQRWEQPGVDRDGRKRFVDFAHALRGVVDLPIYLVHREGLVLRKMGRAYEGLCPFHFEKTGSFVVHTPTFKCFGCGVGGDIYDYLLMANRVGSFREAVRVVADYQGVAMPVEAPRGPAPIWSEYKS